VQHAIGQGRAPRIELDGDDLDVPRHEMPGGGQVHRIVLRDRAGIVVPGEEHRGTRGQPLDRVEEAPGGRARLDGRDVESGQERHHDEKADREEDPAPVQAAEIRE